MSAANDDFLRWWMRHLAPTNIERARIINDLLMHANDDRMTVRDRRDCQRALVLIRVEYESRTRKYA